MTDMTRRRARAIAAAVVALAGAALFRLKLGADPKPVAWLPVVGPAVAALLVQFPSLGAQLLARGLWWSNVVLGVILVWAGTRNESLLGLPLVLGCGAALALVDRRALAAAAEQADFRPVAYAGTIQLLMVLALADAPTLLLFTQVESRRGLTPGSVALGVAALGLLVGFVGLYRVSLWGVLVTAGTSLALGVALASGAVHIDHDLDRPLTAICAVQVLVAAPMLLSLATRRPLPVVPPRVRGALATALLVALALGSVAVAVYRNQRD
ncbi:MAG: hypothetical protein Q8S73_03315 [Deltaproteobacteria bacterium]|nr:hypothetical protein [Myxococcales bacterium]MDP3213109.1 hypothetical protein [Deltaproteobacteria bacterium]